MQHNKPIWIAGLMSGTSLDGVDGACLLTNGDKIFAFGPSAYVAYSETQRDTLRAGLGLWQGDPDLAEVEAIILEVHCAVLAKLPKVQLVGFHGQTLAHDPVNNRTHQIGCGAQLAKYTGYAVAWDFRTNDVALGGQGAPLAPIYHWAMARYARCEAEIAIVNLGGVGNLTWIDPSLKPEMGVLAFDTGPANAPLNDAILSRTGASFDEYGSLAAQGVASKAVIDQLLNHKYFAQKPPKSLDRDEFGFLTKSVENFSLVDAAATLTHAVARSVALSLDHLPSPPREIWITGGGRKNLEIMRLLRAGLPMEVRDIDELGFDGDMVEAQAFAYLAARVLYRLPTSFPLTTGVASPVIGGKISAAS